MDLAEEVKSFIARALKIELEYVTEALALGSIPQWDSFGHINLMMAMESEYGIPVTEETVLRHISYSAISETISTRKS